MTLLLFVTLELHRYLRAIAERAVLCRAIGTQAGFSSQLDPTINWPKGQQSRKVRHQGLICCSKADIWSAEKPGIQACNEAV